MEVVIIFRCFALIYLMYFPVNSVKVKNDSSNTLDSEKPEEFVDETEEAVKRVNHLRVITDKMNKYLTDTKVDSSMFCPAELDVCKALVDRYLDRCKKGDCYTLDGLVAFSSPEKFNTVLPHLAQYETAKYVFRKSGAKQSWTNDFKDFFKSDKGLHSMAEFNNELIRRNLGKVQFNGNSSALLLNEVFYSTTLYYQMYLNKNKLLAKLHNKSRFMRFFFSERRRGPLIRLVRDLVGEKHLDVSHSDLKSLVDSFVLYLTVGNYTSHYKLVLVYADLVKHAVSKALGYRKVSFMMADYLLKMPVDPNNYCKAHAEADCKEKVANYLNRCDEGDCTTMDTVNLLDSKDWLNVKVPELPEVFASFDLFNGSKAKRPNLFVRLFQRQFNRMTPRQFLDLLYDRNTSSVSFKTANQGYLHRFLSKAAFEFAYRVRKFKWQEDLKNSSNVMMSFMSRVTGKNKVYLALPRVRNVFLTFRNYLHRSGQDVKLEDLNTYTMDLQHSFFSYLEDPYQGEYSEEHREEWEKMKQKELKDLESELSTKAADSRNSFQKFWDGLTGKNRGETEEDSSEKKSVEEAEKELNDKVDAAVKNFQNQVHSSA